MSLSEIFSSLWEGATDSMSELRRIFAEAGEALPADIFGPADASQVQWEALPGGFAGEPGYGVLSPRHYANEFSGLAPGVGIGGGPGGQGEASRQQGGYPAPPPMDMNPTFGDTELPPPMEPTPVPQPQFSQEPAAAYQQPGAVAPGMEQMGPPPPMSIPQAGPPPQMQAQQYQGIDSGQGGQAPPPMPVSPEQGPPPPPLSLDPGQGQMSTGGMSFDQQQQPLPGMEPQPMPEFFSNLNQRLNPYPDAQMQPGGQQPAQSPVTIMPDGSIVLQIPGQPPRVLGQQFRR